MFGTMSCIIPILTAFKNYTFAVVTVLSLNNGCADAINYFIYITGVFMETIECEFAFIYHRMYMHQKYIRLFVSDIYAVKVCDLTRSS